VLEGKGQFICAALDCQATELCSYEVNFHYIEQGVKKNALVKVRLCGACADKLNHSRSGKKRRVDNENAEITRDTSGVRQEEDAGGSDVEEQLPRKQRRNDTWKEPTSIEDISNEKDADEYLDELFV
jgi:hypothetical protein